jgi:hypothetical protein
MKKTYSEKLKDPRWQKKRLEVMQRDAFKCVWCCDGTKTLNVHHLSYHGDPWDTPVDQLITVCEECHQQDHEHRSSVEKELIRVLKVNGFGIDDISALIWAFQNDRQDRNPWMVAHGVSHMIKKDDMFDMICRDFFK